jgi:putative addiction module killer protein
MRYEIEKTAEFNQWLKKLKDRQALLAISSRLTRIVLGNFGDAKPVGNDIHELWLFIGPGYRMYYTIKDDIIIVLLIGGDKSSQEKDIRKAKELAKALREATHEQDNNAV